MVMALKKTRTRLRARATVHKLFTARLMPAWQKKKTQARLHVLNDFVEHTPTANHTAGASCRTRQVYAASRVKLPAPIWEPKAYSKTGPRICFPTERNHLTIIMSCHTPPGISRDGYGKANLHCARQDSRAQHHLSVTHLSQQEMPLRTWSRT